MSMYQYKHVTMCCQAFRGDILISSKACDTKLIWKQNEKTIIQR